MKIQWNSDAAQEVLERLRRADRGLEEGVRQAKTVRAALADANAEGDDRALEALSERFESCARGLEALAQELADFRSAVNRADAEFEDAERSNARLADNFADSTPSPDAYVVSSAPNWQPGAYAVMPQMRVRPAPIPRWLEQAAMTPGAL